MIDVFTVSLADTAFSHQLAPGFVSQRPLFLLLRRPLIGIVFPVVITRHG
jgi:hypothetical protein